MEAAAVAKLTAKAPAGAGSVASDATAKDGVDFAALLAAQFQGADGVASPAVGVVAGAEAPLQADGAVRDLKLDVVPDAQAGAVTDPTLQAMVLMPGFATIAQAMQQAAPEIKPALSASSPDKSLGDRKVSELSGLVSTKAVAAELAVGGKSLSVSSPDKSLGDQKVSELHGLVSTKAGAAELAVGGKSLPSGNTKDAEAKVVDAFKLPSLPGDAQQAPDALSAVPALMSANQLRAANEIKAPIGGVQPPVGASGWGDAVGQKVVWMAGQHQQVAELHLNPPHLGPMEVRLTISNDQVSAIFVSHQPAVREAIEAAMPRLREMFADSGMMLGNAMVSSDSLPQHQNSGQEKQSRSGSRSDFPLVDGYSMPLTSRGVMPLHGDGSGMVDLFA